MTTQTPTKCPKNKARHCWHARGRLDRDKHGSFCVGLEPVKNISVLKCCHCGVLTDVYGETVAETEVRDKPVNTCTA